ncbi:phosphoribosyltransferase [Candidatus Sumerlaeota bacterium]|nr:phosphoribosyltransferase [Candidatus Sumerlaeota bacterium]
MRFADRSEAGRALAEHLLHYENDLNAIVLGLPRGGVPVAFEVAERLHLPLDVFLVRKIGVPCQRELAMGAITLGNIRLLNHELIDQLSIPDTDVEDAVARETDELSRQDEVFRHGRTPPPIDGRTIILVDDGLATGATMAVAIKALRLQHPHRIIVAVPVGAAATCRSMAADADEVVCAINPEHFLAVGVWYGDFSPTSDEEVVRLMDRSHDDLVYATLDNLHRRPTHH